MGYRGWDKAVDVVRLFCRWEARPKATPPTVVAPGGRQAVTKAGGHFTLRTAEGWPALFPLPQGGRLTLRYIRRTTRHTCAPAPTATSTHAHTPPTFRRAGSGTNYALTSLFCGLDVPHGAGWRAASALRCSGGETNTSDYPGRAGQAGITFLPALFTCLNLYRMGRHCASRGMGGDAGATASTVCVNIPRGEDIYHPLEDATA